MTEDKRLAYTLFQLLKGFFTFGSLAEKHILLGQSIQRPCNLQKIEYRSLIKVTKAYKRVYILDAGRCVPVPNSFYFSRVHLDFFRANN